jgi:hypothetical protein
METFYEPKIGVSVMRVLFVSLLLLTLVGCANSNFTFHAPALYYTDSQAQADLHQQRYVADLNRRQSTYPFVDSSASYTYSPLAW